MAATTFTGQEIYSKQLFTELKPLLAPIREFSTDFSQEAKAPGESVSVQLIESDAVADFDATSNNFVRSASSNKKVTVTFNTPKIVGFNVTPFQVQNFNPGWWKEKANLDAHKMAKSILTDVMAGITADNFAKGQTIASDSAITLAEVTKIRTYCAKQDIDPAEAVLMLDLALYHALANLYNTTKSGLTAAQAVSELAMACGFKAVHAMPVLPAGLLGFAALPSALAVAGRNFRPVSDKPYESVREITDPDSGIGLTMVEFVDGATGNDNISTTGMFGSTPGVGDALIRITKANG